MNISRTLRWFFVSPAVTRWRPIQDTSKAMDVDVGVDGVPKVRRQRRRADPLATQHRWHRFVERQRIVDAVDDGTDASLAPLTWIFFCWSTSVDTVDNG